MTEIVTTEKWQFTKIVSIKGEEDTSQSLFKQDLTLEKAEQYLHEADLEVLKDWGLESEYKGNAQQHRISALDLYKETEVTAYIELMD